MQAIDTLLQESLGQVFTAATVEIRHRNAVIYRAALGSLDPEGRREGDYPRVKRATPFDLASLTKLFTASAFFRLVEAGKVMLGTPVAQILPEFSGMRPILPYENPLNTDERVEVVPPTDAQVDTGAVTFKHLLTHSSGLPAWINLRRGNSVPERLEMCLNTPFAYPTGMQVVYSDVGYILLGLAISKLADAPLDEAIKKLVAKPLDFNVRYGPLAEGIAPPTEFCQWRKRRVVGEVHDENAVTLGGIAGHAGLFASAEEVATLAQIYLDEGGGFIGPRLAREATRLHIGNRGLGWMMRATGPSSSGQYFSENSFGHTGFVGTSVWVWPEQQLVVALLTNYVFFGRDADAILAYRARFHDTVIEALRLQL